MICPMIRKLLKVQLLRSAVAVSFCFALGFQIRDIIFTIIDNQNGSTATTIQFTRVTKVTKLSVYNNTNGVPVAASSLTTPLPKAKPSKPSNTTKVIVLAYYRGGSSFLGRLLDYNPNFLYYFEPFADPFLNYKTKHRIQMRGDIYIDYKIGKFRPIDRTMQSWLVRASVGLLNCDLTDLGRGLFLHPFLTQPGFVHGHSLDSYRQCMKLNTTNKHQKVSRREKKDWRRKMFDTCIPKLTESCTQHKFRAFKTIRMTLEQIREVIMADPEVKVIYSPREPLGMISSRMQMDKTQKRFIPMTVDKRAQEVCSRMRHDLAYLEKLKLEFPQNVLLTHFEEVYTDLHLTAKLIYKFLGETVPKSVTDFIGKQKKLHGKGGRHDNQTDKWRKYLSASDINIVKKYCSDILNKYHD